MPDEWPSAPRPPDFLSLFLQPSGERMTDTKYNPAHAESRWYEYWEKNGFFSAHPGSGKEPFTIVIPPPNVTGGLHVGHALFVTLEDLIEEIVGELEEQGKKK